MMDPFDLLRLNILSPVVLAFALGIVATLIRSDLRLPDDVYAALAIYLLFAIGLKGGAELAATPLADFWRSAVATITLGLVTPLLAFTVLRQLGRFDLPNAAAIAAHYGSVSVVTFTAGLAFLDAIAMPAEGFMPTLVVILEIPGIMVAIALARGGSRGNGGWSGLLHELLTGRSIVLLLGGLVVGLLSGPAGLERVAPFFVTPFQGVLTLFLLEMGIVAARRLRDLRSVGPFLVGFAIAMPILHGTLGVVAGWLAGLSVGGTTILGILAASASYIAAPAAVRMSLPTANPSLYLTASLGITFPFNLAIGIPLYHGMARLLHGV